MNFELDQDELNVILTSNNNYENINTKLFFKKVYCYYVALKSPSVLNFVHNLIEQLQQNNIYYEIKSKKMLQFISMNNY